VPALRLKLFIAGDSPRTREAAENIARAVRRCFSDAKYTVQRDEALGVIRQFLEQAAESSRRALERASNQTPQR
jgi:glutamyl-tRNA reductase